MLHQLIVYLIAFYCITKCCWRAQQPTLMLSIEIHNTYIVRQIQSAHAQPLLRNNFIATCREHTLEIENQLANVVSCQDY